MAAPYTNIATLQRQTVTPTASGGASRTWTTRASNVPCRLSSVSAHEQAEFKRSDIVVDAAVYFQTDQGILKDDRILVGTNSYLVATYAGTYNPQKTIGLFKATVRTRNQMVNP